MTQKEIAASFEIEPETMVLDAPTTFEVETRALMDLVEHLHPLALMQADKVRAIVQQEAMLYVIQILTGRDAAYAQEVLALAKERHRIAAEESSKTPHPERPLIEFIAEI